MKFSSKHRISELKTLNVKSPSGKLLASQKLKLFWYENNYGFARLAIRAPKKEIRSAVSRNRLKRLVREVFRNRLDTLPPCDYLVVCRQHLSICSNKEIGASLSIIFNEVSPISVK